MAYTLGQAAKATGLSKTAISQAIAASRISATKDEFGRWRIDPSELHRVYPPQREQVDENEHPVDAAQAAEIERLKATVEGLERLCRQIESERDHLREQNTRLTALLPPPQPAPVKRRWWQFGRRE
ncbi:MAG TPA: hypothetical protein VJ770_07175 [Stellaceae bacterium]|nr:hypothetical protein [Stellaceae bacterium]